RYHSDGICASRCGSLARSGLPDAVIAPSTTQLFDPRADPREGRSNAEASARVHELSTTEDTADTEVLLALASVSTVSSVVAVFFETHGRSASLRIVNAFGEYGGNSCAARSGPISAVASRFRISIE